MWNVWTELFKSFLSIYIFIEINFYFENLELLMCLTRYCYHVWSYKDGKHTKKTTLISCLYLVNRTFKIHFFIFREGQITWKLPHIWTLSNDQLTGFSCYAVFPSACLFMAVRHSQSFATPRFPFNLKQKCFWDMLHVSRLHLEDSRACRTFFFL